MSGRCNKYKTRKPLETTLGQARKDIVDESHLRKPITTSVRSLNQLFTLFDSATNEVKDYVANECEILYECKTCRTIFRSLANFILHKRSYCQDKFQPGPAADSGGAVVEVPAEGHLMPIINKLRKLQEIDCLTEPDLATKPDNGDDDVVFIKETKEAKDNVLVLERIEGTQQAVFQTQRTPTDTDQSMKTEVLELDVILDTNTAALDATGKATVVQNPVLFKNLVCKECNFTFSTLKTFRYHVKYKHNKTCIVYPCPDCKQTFSNPWGVYRHLFKVHRRTNAQVKRMRAQIHSTRVRKDQEPLRKKHKVEELKEDVENEWVNSVEEDKDFQMCGGCGRRFERKAALQSHSQMCQKRLAIFNHVKERKKKATVDKAVKVVKGAQRRKNAFVQRCAEMPEIEIFTISDDSNSHENEAAGDDDFKDYITDDTDLIFLARAAPYMERNELKCVECSEQFLSPNQLLSHMSLHFSWFRFQCSRCPFTSFNKYDCTSHALVNHSTPHDLMVSTVLPIPKWKVLSASHNFHARSQELVNNNVIKTQTVSEPETIILDDDEAPELEIQAFVAPKAMDPGPSKPERPVRNRTKSVKTNQSDFIYDLGKVLKLHDNSVRARLKK